METNKQTIIPKRGESIRIINGKYLFKIIIENHPHLDFQFVETIGIVRKGMYFCGNCFLDTKNKIQVKLLFIPIESDSQLSIDEDVNPIPLNTLLQINNIIELSENVDKRFNFLSSSSTSSVEDRSQTVLSETNDTLVKGNSFVANAGLVIQSVPNSSNLSKTINFSVSNDNISSYMLPCNLVITPASILFTTDNILTIRNVTILRPSEEENCSVALINLLVSMYFSKENYARSRDYHLKKNRKEANQSSQNILLDYTGKQTFSEENAVSVSLPKLLQEQLFRYLDYLGINVSELTIPTRFDSSEPIKQVIQILNLSYIPYREFIANSDLSSRQIGPYIRCQDDTSQLKIPKFFGEQLLPPNIAFNSNEESICLQIYAKLPDQVTPLIFLKNMLRGTYWELGIVLLSSLISALITLLPPIAITYILSNLLPYSSQKPFIEIIALLFSIAISVFILQLIQSRYSVRLETKADLNIQTSVTNRLLQLPASSIFAEDSGDLESRVAYLTSLRQIFTKTVSPLFTQSLTIVFNFLLLIYYSWTATVFATIPLLLIMCSAIYVAIFKSKYLSIMMENDGKIFAGLFRYLLGIVPFRSNLTTDFVRYRYLLSARPLVVYLFRATRLGNRLNTLDATIKPLTYVFIFPIIVYSVSHSWAEPITVGIFAGFSAALTTLFSTGRSLVDSTLSQFIQGYAIWRRANKFLNITPEKSVFSVATPTITGLVTFKDVSFGYPASDNLVLHDISFEVSKGEFIGLTGESGCGKSTLMRLAYCVLNPSSGSILFDNISSLETNLRALRANFGVITQDVRLLNASLRENILAGISLSDDDVMKAIESASLSPFVQNLPMGLETMLSERTTTISMGQKQLILIARALVRRPKILFMDEATSYLDMNTESIVTNNIKSLGITRFAVAHRISSIQTADRIIFLEAGRILGFDNHNQLIKDLPQYEQLCRASKN